MLNPATRSLVVKHCGQSRPPGVSNVLDQRAAGQGLNVDVFDCDSAEAINQITGKFVKVITAPVGDICVTLPNAALRAMGRNTEGRKQHRHYRTQTKPIRERANSARRAWLAPKPF